jgi:hypothetical protein
MALIDKASLLFVPSVVAEGKAFNILPSGNRAPDSTDQNSGYDQTRADFDFDRGSNAAATRIGSDGLLKKYRENLFINSNMFTGISLDGITRTTAQADPFGGSNAIKITENTSASNHRWYKLSATPTGVFTASVYAKYDSRKIIRIHIDNGNVLAGFDILNGTVYSTSSSVIDAKIEAVGTDGWYRCSVTANGTAAGWIGIYMLSDSGANSYTGDGSSSAFLFGFQLESGLVSTDYLESTSVTGKAGVLVDLPRINYDANGENGSLLLEPSRQQLLQYSEYFAGWDNSTYPITIASNQIASPSGNINASLLTPNSGSSRHAIREIISCSATTYTLSAFYKKANSQYVILSDGGDTSWHIVTADLENGTITDETNATGTIESYENDWYRITCTFTRTNASTIQAFLGASPTDSNSGLPIFDDTSLTTYAYGAQCELGSYPTSYIPNHGTTGGVTRAADSMNTIVPELTNSGYTATMYIEFDGPLEPSATDLFKWQPSADTSTRFWIYTTAVGIAGGGAYGFNKNNSKHKFIFRVSDSTTRSIFYNGTKVVNTTSVAAGNGYDKIEILDANALQSFNVSKIIGFNEALTDAECETLTTL